MNQSESNASVSNRMLWGGRIMSAIPVLMLLMSAAMKFLMPPEVVDGFEQMELPVGLAIGLGILELSCTVIYLIPKTSVLGAILLTGYLGGATLTHLRIGDPWLQILTPAMLGVLVWGGIFLRDPRLQALIPLRQRS